MEHYYPGEEQITPDNGVIDDYLKGGEHTEVNLDFKKLITFIILADYNTRHGCNRNYRSD